MDNKKVIFSCMDRKEREDAQMGANMREVGIFSKFTCRIWILKEKIRRTEGNGVESCQLVCWDRSLLNEETAAVVREAVREKGDRNHSVLVRLGRPEGMEFL